MSEKWDTRFLGMAILVASWSKDPSTKVGAVIVDQQRRVVSVGYNGMPPNVPDDVYLQTRDLKIMCTLHAESNAIDFAHRDISGCTIYVTHPPCTACASRIITNGIKEVVSIEPNSDFLSRWELQNKIADDILTAAKVKTRKIKQNWSNTECQTKTSSYNSVSKLWTAFSGFFRNSHTTK